jgi:hypothetical protein
MAGIMAPHPRYSRLINSRPCQLNNGGLRRVSAPVDPRAVDQPAAACFRSYSTISFARSSRALANVPPSTYGVPGQ